MTLETLACVVLHIGILIAVICIDSLAERILCELKQANEHLRAMRFDRTEEHLSAIRDVVECDRATAIPSFLRAIKRNTKHLRAEQKGRE